MTILYFGYGQIQSCSSPEMPSIDQDCLEDASVREERAMRNYLRDQVGESGRPPKEVMAEIDAECAKIMARATPIE